MKKSITTLLSFMAFYVLSFSQVSLVKDIDPGPGSGLGESAVRGILYNNHLIFPAKTPENGNELWISDGTEDGTYLLKDIHPGAGSSDPSRFISAFDKIYFNAGTPSEGKELWVTDGTPEGTYMVMDIEPGTTGSDPLFGAVYKDKLYFAATSSSDRELWTVDASETVSLFYDLNATAPSRPRGFTVIGDKMYFAANEHPVNLAANDEDEPFVTDGTIEGTVKLIDVTSNPNGAGVRDFVGLGPDVYFLASTTGGAAPNHHEIFKTDGTPENTILLQDLLGSYWLTPYSDFLLFFYDSGLHKITPGGTWSRLSGIHNNGSYNTANPIVNLDNELFLSAQNGNGSTGVELYATKGTTISTNIVKDIFPGPGSSNPNHLVVAEDRILFAASSSETNRELYESDGTPAGTKMVFDLNPGEEGSNPSRLVAGDGVVYFYASTPETGFELYKYKFGTTGIEPVNVSFEGKIYPQPGIDDITVEWPVEKAWEKCILLDPSGRSVAEYHIKGTTFLYLNMRGYPRGTYFLKLSNGNTLATVPLIIN